MAIAENKSGVGTFSFTVTLAVPREITTELENRLFAAGCDDALLRSCDGVVYLDFDRDSDSLGEAVGTAVRDVTAAGCTPAHIILLPTEPDLAE